MDPANDPDADSYVPEFLLPLLPNNPDFRDGVICLVWLFLCSILGIAVLKFVHEWVGVALMAIGFAHFSVRYRTRANERYFRRRRERESRKGD